MKSNNNNKRKNNTDNDNKYDDDAPSLNLVCCFLNFPILVLALVIGYSQHYSAGTVEPPPSDFGSGQMFNQIAERYDIVNRIMALGMDQGWRRQVAERVRERLEKEENDRDVFILDVATGTADVALAVKQSMNKQKKNSVFITGLDPSENMLQIGRNKIAAAGYTTDIVLYHGDAQDFVQDSRFPSNHFHAATMAFGIRNVPNREKALCQIHTALQSNAVFLVMEFSEPEGTSILAKLTKWAIRHVIPTVGGILSGNNSREYWHLQKSIQDFPKASEFAKQISELECDKKSRSFRVDQVHQLTFGAVQIYEMTVLKDDASANTAHQEEETVAVQHTHTRGPR